MVRLYRWETERQGAEWDWKSSKSSDEKLEASSLASYERWQDWPYCGKCWCQSLSRMAFACKKKKSQKDSTNPPSFVISAKCGRRSKKKKQVGQKQDWVWKSLHSVRTVVAEKGSEVVIAGPVFDWASRSHFHRRISLISPVFSPPGEKVS